MERDKLRAEAGEGAMEEEAMEEVGREGEREGGRGGLIGGVGVLLSSG